MLSFRESKNFLWYTSDSDELGRGSFGVVYRGLNKITGDPVAVKIPHSNVSIAEDIETREIGVYQRVNHINIVRLLGYEEEKCVHRRDKTKKVLIMEICDGGSLYKVLQHPMNHFGLEEDEFLTVLRDLTNGMKYLRENSIIHRDLKPANIMKCISEDGSSIYKITDFGAARELAEHQEYSSIFGTEEYLHPDVYEQALLPETAIPNKKFSPSTDLWSIGATLYHVATGLLPFRPTGGRKNRRVMHLMTTKKESGVISAYQMKDSGTVVFEKHLPKNCLLSPDLKKLLCPLLAGLMEVDPRNKLTFESYFQFVEDILGKRQLHVFYINKLQLVRVYLDPKVVKQFEDLKGSIETHTKIPRDDQILLFKDSTLKEVLETGSTYGSICTNLPHTSKTNPVILCNRSDNEVAWKHDKMASALKRKLFPNMVDYVKDAEIATHNCSVAYHIKRQIQDICLKVNLIYSAVQTINQVVVTQLTSASKENILICKTVHSMSNQFEMMKSFHSLCTDFSSLVPEDINTVNNNGPTFHENVKELKKIYNSKYSDFKTLEGMLQQLKPSIDALLGSRVQNRFLMSGWEASSSKVKGVNDFQRTERIAFTIATSVSHSYGDISGDLPSIPQRRRCPEPEEQCLHLIERTKMIKNMEKLERLQTECLINFTGLNSVLSEWYKTAVTAYIQPEILTNDIKRLQVKITTAEESLAEAIASFKLQLQRATQALAAFPIVTSNIQNKANRKESVKAIRERLQELVRVQEEMQSNFRVNAELCNQLQGLLCNSMSDMSP